MTTSKLTREEVEYLGEACEPGSRHTVPGEQFGRILTMALNSLDLATQVEALQADLDPYNEHGGHCAQVVEILTRAARIEPHHDSPDGYKPHAVDAAVITESRFDSLRTRLTETEARLEVLISETEFGAANCERQGLVGTASVLRTAIKFARPKSTPKEKQG